MFENDYLFLRNRNAFYFRHFPDYGGMKNNGTQVLCPRHKMAEGNIEFTLSVCVYVFVCFRSCIPESCPAHNFVQHGRI